MSAITPTNSAQPSSFLKSTRCASPDCKRKVHELYNKCNHCAQCYCEDHRLQFKHGCKTMAQVQQEHREELQTAMTRVQKAVSDSGSESNATH